MSSYNYYNKERIEVTQFLPEKYKRVLEIGCGEGDFFKFLNKDCEIWGVELDEISALKAGIKGHKIILGEYQKVADQLPDNYFDLIVCNDVIEHMGAYIDFLVDIKKKMTIDAVLIGSVPNVRFYKNLYEVCFKKDWQYKEAGILDKTHLRFFTEKSLKRALLDSGFRIEKFSGINSNLIKINSMKSIFRIFLLAVSILLSLGYYWDIQFLQYGFCVKKDL